MIHTKTGGQAHRQVLVLPTILEDSVRNLATICTIREAFGTTSLIESSKKEMSEARPAEFTGKRLGRIHTIIAMIIWLGSVHLNLFIILTCFFFLPLHKFFL